MLLYDNRQWGESDGLPRQHSNPHLQANDYYDAFNHACTFSFVDPSLIVYWGTSLSGGNVIFAAAIDKRIKAAIVQCSSVSGQVRAEAIQDRINMLLSERASISNDGSEPRVPLIASNREAALNGSEAVLFPDIQAYDFLNGLNDEENWTNNITTQTSVHLALSEPQAVIHRISPTPLLMVVPEKDLTIPTTSQIAAFEKAREPKEMVMIKKAGHFDLYSGQPFEENIAAQLAFLQRIFALGG